MDLNFLNFVTTAGCESRLDFSTYISIIISKIDESFKIFGKKLKTDDRNTVLTLHYSD